MTNEEKETLRNAPLPTIDNLPLYLQKLLAELQEVGLEDPWYWVNRILQEHQQNPSYVQSELAKFFKHTNVSLIGSFLPEMCIRNIHLVNLELRDLIYNYFYKDSHLTFEGMLRLTFPGLTLEEAESQVRKLKSWSNQRPSPMLEVLQKLERLVTTGSYQNLLDWITLIKTMGNRFSVLIHEYLTNFFKGSATDSCKCLVLRNLCLSNFEIKPSLFYGLKEAIIDFCFSETRVYAETLSICFPELAFIAANEEVYTLLHLDEITSKKTNLQTTQCTSVEQEQIFEQLCQVLAQEEPFKPVNAEIGSRLRSSEKQDDSFEMTWDREGEDTPYTNQELHQIVIELLQKLSRSLTLEAAKEYVNLLHFWYKQKPELVKPLINAYCQRNEKGSFLLA